MDGWINAVAAAGEEDFGEGMTDLTHPHHTPLLSHWHILTNWHTPPPYTPLFSQALRVDELALSKHVKVLRDR